MAAMSHRDDRIKPMRLRDVHGGFEKIFFGGELKRLPRAIGSDRFQRHVPGGGQSFTGRGA